MTVAPAPTVLAANERTNHWIRILALVFGLLLLIPSLAGLWVSLSTLAAIDERSINNKHHLDCVVGVLFRQDPPACPGVKEQLLREGILPPGFPATSTTTTTTPPEPRPKETP